ncbi:MULTISPECIES: hypothetical protein [unclassified Burkholderia]|uniref:hypothetical protein n=1 Tax=unclassified Burkholderia TaxID=2613784 RepID=UPI000A5DBC36|nr:MULTISPECIES: hypothetical protein [unclassified Burkholderia]MBR8234924.1 hypothetical protein [Burkholderia sp. AU32357]MBY4875861.1 hypothetical protein [Burkholderia sp. AU42008]
MNWPADHAMHRIKRIFASLDDRLIVLLRCTPHVLARRDTVKCLHTLRTAYEDDLEIVPFLAASCRRTLPEAVERTLGRRVRRTGFSLAVEHDAMSGSGLPTAWWLWDGRAPLRIPSDAPLVATLCPPAPLPELGWALPLAEGDCLTERLAALDDGALPAGGRRVLVDLRAHGASGVGMLRHTRLAAETIGSHRDLLGGAVLDLRELVDLRMPAPPSSRDACIHLDTTKALLDELANVVTHCRIATYTRAGRSLWRRL